MEPLGGAGVDPLVLKFLHGISEGLCGLSHGTPEQVTDLECSQLSQILLRMEAQLVRLLTLFLFNN